jgi:hypothetical protein
MPNAGRLGIISAAFVLTAACTPTPRSGDVPAAADNRATAATAEHEQKPDWDRMRECSARGDAIAAREGWGKPGNDADSWETHYSPKYGRCFVRARIMNRESKNGFGPFLYYELRDAFEGTVLSSCPVGRSETDTSLFCSVPNQKGAGSCATCADFMTDHMSK